MRRTFRYQDKFSTLYRSERSDSGFTLIELLTTIAILTAVIAALMGLIQSFYKSNSFLIEQTAALDSARRGMSDAVVALREASYGDDGSYPIAQAATSSITVYADLDSDSAVERVRYVLSNGTFYRTVTNASGDPPVYGGTVSTTTIATSVRNTAATPLFTYYDDAGAQLSTTSPNVASISSVRVSLMVDLNPNRAPNVFTLTQTATMRNLQN